MTPDMTSPTSGPGKRRDEVFAHLKGLEESLLDLTVRRSALAVDALLADDFVEFGTSGGVYDKETVMEALANARASLKYSAYDFSFVDLAWDVIQVRFRTTTSDPDAKTETYGLRTSIWKMSGGKWRMIFHQGTKTARPASA